MKRHLMLLVLAFVLMLGMFAVGAAAPLSDNCTKDRGTVTCSTYVPSPANNQAGLGTTSVDETQGNTTNTSPEPQDLDSTSSCKPPKSQGTPCG
jgi:hypothetical protein